MYYNRIKCDWKHGFGIRKARDKAVCNETLDKPTLYCLHRLTLSLFYEQIPAERRRQSTYKTVYIQRAFTSCCTLYVTAVPGARPETTAIALRSAHRLSHWDTQERAGWTEVTSVQCVCVLCLYVCASPSVSVYFCLWRKTFSKERARERRRRRSERNTERKW